MKAATPNTGMVKWLEIPTTIWSLRKGVNLTVSKLVQYDFLTLSAQEHNCLSSRSNTCNYIANVKIRGLNSVRSDNKLLHDEVASLAL